MRAVDRAAGTVLISELLQGVPGLVAGVSTRALDGAGALSRALGWSGEPPVFLRQVHGARVVEAPPPVGAEGDGLVVRHPGVLAGVRVADCLPVIVAPRAGGVVAVLHAGWRGLAAGVIEEGLARLRAVADRGPDQMVAALGPAIGPCCFEVGPEVVAAVAADPGRVRAGCGDRAFLDLRGAAADRLVRAGVPASALDAEAPCTRCRGDLFHSYRRDGAQAGRIEAVAGYASRNT